MIKNGKTQRLKLKMQRQSAHISNSSNPDLAVNQTVVEAEAHNFRLDVTFNKNARADKVIQTVFHVRESDQEVEKRIIDARIPLAKRNRTADPTMYQEIVSIPLRPRWNNTMKSAAVKKNENAKFEEYLETIYARYPPSRLNHFEHNLDVWRQLWRVVEISDLLVICVDARHPLFHFPPSLYAYVVHQMKKPFVLVINKIDLIPRTTLLQWYDYFNAEYPGVLVIFFSSFPNPQTVTCEDFDLNVRKKASPTTPRKKATSQSLSVWRSCCSS